MIKNSKITKISLDDFVDLVASLNLSLYEEDSETTWSKNFRWRKDCPMKDCWILKRWNIGGQSGGSCWGTDHHATSGEPEPDFVELDTILVEVCPEISYLEYKKLMRELKLVEASDRDNDYYGNYDDYAIKAIQIVDLYETRELLLSKGRSFLLRRDNLLEGLKALLVEVVLSTGVNFRSSCDIYSRPKRCVQTWLSS